VVNVGVRNPMLPGRGVDLHATKVVTSQSGRQLWLLMSLAGARPDDLIAAPTATSSGTLPRQRDSAPEPSYPAFSSPLREPD
jgi:hypothetical protein